MKISVWSLWNIYWYNIIYEIMRYINVGLLDYAPVAYFVTAHITNTLHPQAPETLLWRMCTFTKRS